MILKISYSNYIYKIPNETNNHFFEREERSLIVRF